MPRCYATGQRICLFNENEYSICGWKKFTKRETPTSLAASILYSGCFPRQSFPFINNKLWDGCPNYGHPICLV